MITAEEQSVRRTTVTLMALDDFQARIIALQSNLEGTSRKAVKPIEIAFAIKGLMNLGRSMTEIGEALGRSKQWVSKMNKLSHVHPDVYETMSRRVDSPYLWAELVKLAPEEQTLLLRKIQEDVDEVPVRLSPVRAITRFERFCMTRILSVQ